MPVLLFFVGFFALVAGLVMIGFGIPINEFSFGNTLISGGTTALVGGLIIISLSVVVGHLRRIAEALNNQVGSRLPLEAVEPSVVPRAVPVQGRIPFPARPKAEPYPAEPSAVASQPLGTSVEDRMAAASAPMLRNPEEESVEDEVSLSPHTPVSTELGGTTRPAGGGMGGGSQPSTSGWRSSPLPPMRPPAANFDAMWPADAKGTPKAMPPSEPKLFESKFEPKLEPKLEPKSEPRLDSKLESKSEPKLEEKPESLPEVPARDTSASTTGLETEPPKPRAVAVLKSGVVDGMGYTLYVDGSIEAELPQGTLRFASINELRSHLEKNS